MEKSRFTEEQIVFVLKQAELSTSVPDVCRKLAISDATSIRGVKIRRYFSFGAEAYAATGREKPVAEEAGCRSEPGQGDPTGPAGKKELMLARLREWVRDLQARYGASERPVGFALRVSRSSFRYRSVTKATAYCE